MIRIARAKPPILALLLMAGLSTTAMQAQEKSGSGNKVLTPWGEVDREELTSGRDRVLTPAGEVDRNTLISGRERIQRSGKMTLDYRTVILMALQKNLEIEIQRFSPKIRESQLLFEKGAFDPVLAVSVRKEVSERPLNRQDFLSSNQLVEIFNEDNVLAQTSLGGQIETGLRYEVVVQSSKLKNSLNVEPLSRFFPEHVSSASINISQPLLKNFGKDYTYAGRRVAESQLKTEKFRLYGAINQIAAEALSAYVDVIFARERIKVNQETIRLAQQLREENQRRLEQGRMAPIDVIQAESAIAQAQTELILSESFLVERGNVLKSIIFTDFSRHQETIIEPISELTEDSPPLERGMLMTRALQSNTDYQAALQSAETENIRLRFAELDRWPRLDLEMSMGYNGLAGSYEDSFEDFDERTEPNWSVGLVFNMPLGNRQAVARYSEAQYRQHQAILTIKQVENSVASAMSTAINRVDSSNRRVLSSWKNVEFAEAALDAEERRLINGVTTSFNVLQLQDELSQARIRHLETLVEFNKAIIILHAIMGDLPGAYQIQVRTPEYSQPQDL